MSKSMLSSGSLLVLASTGPDESEAVKVTSSDLPQYLSRASNCVVTLMFSVTSKTDLSLKRLL